MGKGGRRLDAVPDRIDVRDWFYQPRLAPLPDQLVNCDRVPFILDQGQEGACTGFALAAVINYLLRSRNQKDTVSPRMLYEMARRYDEWPGEAYEGSSARGAMKGWVRHGVCLEATWPMANVGAEHLTEAVAEEAKRFPGGAFYRVTHREIRDMHAALVEIGILYVTLMVHEGWFEPGPERRRVDFQESGTIRSIELPVIQRRGRATSGHAVALAGYTAEGFIVQNSWGPGWGEGGFALLPYEDYMLHATDVWAAQLGVPVKIDLWAQGYADTTAGAQRAAPIVPLAEIRPYVVNVGNNGELSQSGDYWTTEEDLSRLFREIIPNRTFGWSRRRVLLYLHGGLNDEGSVAKRIVAFRDIMLANEVYPIHVMWESGLVEALKHLLADLFTDVDDRAGGPVSDWLRKTREGLLEARDWTLELTAAAPGSALWREMKENARLSSEHPDGRGGMQRIAHHVSEAAAALSPKDRRSWELHVVGHSAGCIYAAYALPHLLGCGVPLKSLQLMAPAITIDLFRERMMRAMAARKCPVPLLYILSDVGERDDDVGPYGKSLLYLVSNAFEGRRGTPLLGMERFVAMSASEGAEADPLVAKALEGSLVVAGRDPGPLGCLSRSNTHGGFDNDPDTMNSVLRRILGTAPARSFTSRDLQF